MRFAATCFALPRSLCFLVLFWVALATSGTAQQNVRLTPAEMQAAAITAIHQKKPARALDIATALLTRNPGDPEARVIRARALRDLGRNNEAVRAARQAWNAADTRERQYVAATIMAQALSSSGAKTRAQLWLRRAAQLAPSARHRAAAIRDFGYVRSQNPLLLNFGINVAPSSNINNGSIHDTSPLFGWPIAFDLHGSARALSGMEYSANVSGRYRLLQTPRRIDEITFRLHHTGYTISRASQDYLDGVAADTSLPASTRADAAATDASDFATTSLAIGFTHIGANDLARGPYRLDVSAGQTRYGGDPLVRFLRVALGQTFHIDGRSQTRVGIVREWQDGLRNRGDARHWVLSTGYDRLIGPGHRLSVSLDHTRAKSNSATLDYSQSTARVQLALARPIMNVGLTFGASASRKHYPVSPHAADGRRETILGADVTATFRSIDIYGFSPALTFSYAKTDANVALYDRENFGISFGIRSSF